MNGHKQIISARLDGQAPKAVWIRAGLPATPVACKYDEPEMAMHYGLFPTVDILENELGTRLDLRFLAGLTVHIHGVEMNDKLLDLVDAVGAVASHVIALAGDEMMEYKNGKWTAWTF
jgi:hypothetical protein